MRRRRGFSVYELLVALTVLVVVMDIADGVFYSAIYAMQQDDALGNQTASVDAAVAVLRNDVWSAHSIVAADAQHVTLGETGGDVRWSIESDGTLRRNSGGEKSWPCDAATWSFKSGGAVVTLIDPKSPAPMTLCSQMLIGAGR